MGLHVWSEAGVLGTLLRAQRKRHDFVPAVRVHKVHALAEPFDRERARIGERLFARHHFREQASTHRPQRQPVMLVAEIEPQPGMAWRRRARPTETACEPSAARTRPGSGSPAHLAWRTPRPWSGECPGSSAPA